jgi:hypothetical protein
MPLKPTRQMFIRWVKSTGWHPDGLEHILRQHDDEEFASVNVEAMYQAYCGGFRKGAKIQKDKYEDEINRRTL